MKPEKVEATIAGVFGAYFWVMIGNDPPLKAKAGGRLRVKYEDKQGKSQQLREHLLAIGDQVLISLAPEGGTDIEATITDLLPRRNCMQRGAYQRLQTLAANLDGVVIVTSITSPRFSSGFVDRVLVEAALQNLSTTIIANKMDLYQQSSEADQQALDRDLERLGYYESVGYHVFRESLLSEVSSDLASHLGIGRHLLVGQSGVGKSTLLNQLAGEEVQAVGDVGRRGRHTTTNPVLYCLQGGATLVDAPGVREFGLQHREAVEIRQGFVEFANEECKFDDCMHREEPGCAVTDQVAQEEVAEFRLQSYYAIIDSLPEKYKTRKGNYWR